MDWETKEVIQDLYKMFEEGYKLYLQNYKNSTNDKKFEDENFSLPNVCTTTKKDRNLRIYN
jgi:hypothetical protein